MQALIPDVKLSFKFDSAGIKLEPMDYEEEGQEEFDQENESLASKRKTKKKGTKRPRVKVEGDVERYPSGVKKAKKPGDPGWNPRKGEPGWKSRANPLTPKVEPDKGILMNNEENCKIYACLVCDVAVYKPTSQVWLATQFYWLFTIKDQCNQVCFSKTHHENMQQLFLTVAWARTFVPGTPGSVLVSVKFRM